MSIALALAGKRIIITRAPEQSQELAQALEHLGAEVVSLPTVSFAPPQDWQKLDEQLRRLEFFDVLLFLSKNAVRYIFDRCAQLGIKCEMLQTSNRFIGAVGQSTARALEEKGLHVNYIAKDGTGEALARELRESLGGRRVLLPRSDRGDERISKALREAGAHVTEVIAYRTAPAANLDASTVARIRRAEVDAVIFASPSAFQNFQSVIGGTEAGLEELSSRIDFVAIGPTTARSIRDSGARVAVQAEQASISGLAVAIASHYAHPSASARRA
ncbi:MAG TPA: uroporphyrinogen-III synthase [Verrucomicrobiae bacterium]|nr:uroporphyrinogen-III synthase [Verrucomicrobiae bacterium]